MEENKKDITLNRKVLYVGMGLLVVCLLFTMKSFSDKRAFDKKEESLPASYRLSVIDSYKREGASRNIVIGTVLSLASGGVVYLMVNNKIDLDAMASDNKKKVKKGISKKLKQVLEDEE